MQTLTSPFRVRLRLLCFLGLALIGADCPSVPDPDPKGTGHLATLIVFLPADSPTGVVVAVNGKYWTDLAPGESALDSTLAEGSYTVTGTGLKEGALQPVTVQLGALSRHTVTLDARDPEVTVKLDLSCIGTVNKAFIFANGNIVGEVIPGTVTKFIPDFGINKLSVRAASGTQLAATELDVKYRGFRFTWSIDC